MSETLALILTLLAGVLLGAIFFGGLWWTIRRSVSSKQPALLSSSAFYCEWELRWLVSISLRAAIGAEFSLAWLDLFWRASW